MAVIVTVFLYMLLRVDDVSAQTSCVISPDLTTLTTFIGLGRDVEFHCQCMDSNGMMITGTRWLLSDGTAAPTPTQDLNIPNIPPAVLYIPGTFASSDARTYICSSNNMANDPSRDTITLTAPTSTGPTGNRICTIYSPNGINISMIHISSGTQNVILYCICRRNNVAVGPTRWFINGTAVATTASGDNPYTRNNVPSPLIIPSFDATHTGTYGCGFSFAPIITIDLAISAQCVISPNLDTLTTFDGLGRDVEFHCQCMDINGMMITGTRWFLPNGNAAPTQDLNIPPAVLNITTPFTSSDAGTYVCSPNNMADNPSRDTITLNTGNPPDGDRVCTIYSPNVTTNGAFMDIPSGTQNVILYCICRRDNDVAVGPTTWFIDGTAVTATASGVNPYFRNNVPSPLIIPSFTATHSGRYGCASEANTPSVTIDLATIQPPTNVQATMVMPRSVVVTWTVSSSSDVTGYIISYTTTASYTNGGSERVNQRTTTRGTLNNLEEGTTYTITVQATDSDNRMSPNSNVVSVTTSSVVPSSPPQNVVVTSVNPASLMVSWEAPMEINHNGMITGYTIQYTRTDMNNMMSMNVNSGTTDTISGLVAFVNYSVTVAAMNVIGTGSFSGAVVQRSGEDAPTAPRSLKVVNVSDTTVTLSWMSPDPPNGIIRNYQVQYRTIASGNDRYTSMNTMTDDLTYTVTKLMTGIEYDFRVRAHTVTIEPTYRGPFSDVVTTLVGLSPPTNVRVTMLTLRSVEVTWTVSSSPDVTGYIISYTTTAEYIDMNDRSDSVMLSGTTTSHTFNNLEEGTLYTISVRATTDDGTMSGNIVVSVTTYTDVPSSPPQNVMVTSVNPASLMVSWQLPSTINYNGPITGHVIQYTSGGTSNMMNVNSSTTQTISGLVAFVDYSVTVAARTVNGTGPFSNPPVGQRSGEDVPSEPQLLRETVSVNSSSVTLQWMPPMTPNGIITQYSLQYNTTPADNTANNVLMYTISGLSPETVYVLQVRAHTSVGAGPPSNITVITRPIAVSDVNISNGTISSSALTLTWMEISLTNSEFSHYTVFYLPESGPYGLIMTSNRRKRQLTQTEVSMTFTGTTGTLTGLYGAVTYRIQVAIVGILSGQEITGDRSDAVRVTTLEGMPTAPRNLNYTDLTATGVTLTWRRPDPPNGLITQYNVSYSVTNSQCDVLYNYSILQVDNGGDSILSYTWTNLVQGRYQFSVVASTRVGPGETASLMLSTLPNNEVRSDSGSDDNNGVIIALATLLAIAVIGLVISVVINVFLVVQRKQSRYDVNQSNIRYSDVKQSRGNTINDPTNTYIKPPDPEYEAIDTKPNMKPHYDVKMDANPAYQATS